MRGFDIDDRIETLGGERKILRVAADKRKVLDAMALPAKRDSGRVEIEGRVTPRSKRSREKRRATAVTAADFEHVFISQLRLGRDVVIELNARAIGFVGGIKRHVRRRI